MKTGTSIEWKIKRQVAYAVMEMELKESSEDETDTDKSRTIDAAEDR